MSRRPIRPRRRPALALGLPEILEPRVVPAIFVVTSADDSGPGTLREAIDFANASSDFDEIRFNISGSAHIQLTSYSLPTIVNPVLIDGYTQPGSQPNTASAGTNAVIPVQIDGSLLSSFSDYGLAIAADGVTIRGLAINSFMSAGIAINSSSDTVIAGNFLEGNGRGVLIVNATGGSIGGEATADRNLISSNDLAGIELSDLSSSGFTNVGVSIRNNLIGTDASGNFAGQPSQNVGIVVAASAQDIQILDNVVSGNGSSGIHVLNPGVIRTVIQRNRIGVRAEGDSALPNGGDGIRISDLASGTLIGGIGSGTGNIIANNSGAGVSVEDSPGNSILGNSIYDNYGLGIVTTGSDITPMPSITSVVNTGNGTLVQGILPQTAAGVTYRLELFQNEVPDPSGFGEGETFLTGLAVSGQSGSTPFSFFLPLSIPAGSYVTATTTDASTDTTSEFSEATSVLFVNPLIVTNTNDEGIGSLRYAIEFANQKPGADTIIFNIPGPGPHVILPSSPLPDITDTATIDATTQPGYVANTSATGFNGIIPVVLSGAGLDIYGDGLVFAAPDSAVAGLSIIDFTEGQAGIRIYVDNVSVTASLLGIDPSGASHGNDIGLAVSGYNPLLPGGISVRIGGSSPAERNVISGNAGDGIWIDNAQAIIANNLIGVGFDGTTARPNGQAGITIQGDGSQVGPGNVIAQNAVDGVHIVSGSGNSILDNVIIGNGAPGIRVDPGANGNQPAPTIDLATPTMILGHFLGSPNTTYLLQFFANNVATAGLAQGQVPIGQQTIVTGPSGYVEFTFTPTTTLTVGQFITSTATATATNNTSPFSNAEDVISPFVVTNTNDSGRGSLRFAIQFANLIPGFNSIIFAIPGPGPHTIYLATPLPAIEEAVDIDGATQPGFAGGPVVAVDGSSIQGDAEANGFVILASNTSIRSLAIGNFSGFGIVIQGDGGSRLLGNFIGTDTSGLQRRPNASGGVYVNNSPNNLIEGNLISGNGAGSDAAGIDVRGPNATNTAIRANNIGLASDGQTPLGNSAYGVFVGFQAGGTVIDGNVISGNGNGAPGTGAEIFISGLDDAGQPLPTAIGGHRISNNLIGTNAFGNRKASNAAFGIVIDDIPGNLVTNNTISGSAFVGLLINGGRAQNNVVTFNRIGTDATGQFAIPNGSNYQGKVVGDGIDVVNATNNQIGGNGAGNVIAGNARYGVYLFGTAVDRNQVDANLYGKALNGSSLPNDAGDIARQRNDRSPVIVTRRRTAAQPPRQQPRRPVVRPRLARLGGGATNRPLQSASVTPRFSN